MSYSGKPDGGIEQIVFAGVIASAVFALGLGVAIYLRYPAAPPSPPPDIPTAAKAEVIARKAVLLALKHPYDAEFRAISAVDEGTGYWTVNGLVKAPNGFGLPITDSFTVRLAVAQEGRTGWRWNIALLRIGEVEFESPQQYGEPREVTR